MGMEELIPFSRFYVVSVVLNNNAPHNRFLHGCEAFRSCRFGNLGLNLSQLLIGPSIGTPLSLKYHCMRNDGESVF